MQVAGSIFISLAILLFIISGILFLIYRTFEYNEKAVDKVTALLIDVKYKKDVPVYGQRGLGRGPIRLVMRIKDYSKGTYEYYVNKKRYKIRYVEYVTSGQMPNNISVAYLKWIPKIAYVKTDSNPHFYDVYSFISALIGGLFFLEGLALLF